MVVTKDQDKMGTRPITGGARRKGSIDVPDATNSQRKFSLAEQVPGMFFEELAPGEKINIHSNQGNDVNLGEFEQAILEAIAWANEIPPSIYRLKFSANYSASQGESNEFKLFLNKDRSRDADQLYKPIYQEFFISAVLAKKIVADGFIAAWRDPRQYDIFGAWILSDWTGAIKPMVDPVKQVNGYISMRDNGWITNARAAREFQRLEFDHQRRRDARSRRR